MKKSSRWLLSGLLIWMLVNSLQSYFTELDPDEAYYWMYAQKLAWGFFDHPPMVALMIRAGYELIPNELGVRLMTILMHAGTVFLVWLLAGKPEEKRGLVLLFLLLGAMPMFQLYGFITTPDPPLLFFTAFFFWRYQFFLKNQNCWNTVLLGLAMVLMLYSKYHGVLVILFTLGSNLRLLLRPRFYVASFLGAFLFIPHLWWQVANEFPSLKYHLVGRNNPYAIKHTLNFVINQVVNFSPLLFPLWIMVLRKWPAGTAMQRAYLYTTVGFWGFFLLATLKGHAEPQWTVVLTIPLALMGWSYLKKHPHRRRLFYRLSMISVALVLTVRILLMTELSAGLIPEFHKKEWVRALKERAGNRPVLFVDNYRDPSTYSFYSGDFSAAVNDPVSYRRNQFDIWSFEERYHGKDVLLFGLPEWCYCREMQPFTVFRKNRKTCAVDDIQIVQQLEIKIKQEQGLAAQSGSEVEWEVVIHNPYTHEINLHDRLWPVRPILYIVGSGMEWESEARLHLSSIPGRSTVNATWKSSLPALEEGKYRFYFMLEGNRMIYSINSKGYELFVN